MLHKEYTNMRSVGTGNLHVTTARVIKVRKEKSGANTIKF